MRDFCFILLCLTLSFSNIYSQDWGDDNTYALISDDEIKDRLSNIQSDIVKPKFDPAVRSYIRTYTVKNRDRTEAMLGRTVMYFPLFEKILIEGGLPTDLKYLSVVESALNAQAVSRSGAVGLWQFMTPTGKECGLSINRTVDERKDPEKATRAAVKYLAKQYKRYGNWELALAAYNGGAGRVNRAIKRGRSKNFWKIRRHLPRETRNYVPAFIAATYINHYYQDHHLNPVYPDQKFQNTETVKVYKTLTFNELEEVTGTPMYIIEYLNPSYKKNYIPSSIMGNNLVLPQERMAVFKNYYQLPDSGDKTYVVGERVLAPRYKPLAPVNAKGLYYTVDYGDDINSLAKAFACEEGDIMKWNKLTSSKLRKGQSLLIYISKEAIQPVALLEPLSLIRTEAIAMEQPEKVDWEPVILTPVSNKKSSSKSKKERKRKKKAKKKKYVYHKIVRGESLFTISAQYEGVSVRDLIELNDIDSGEALEKGKKLKIKEK